MRSSAAQEMLVSPSHSSPSKAEYERAMKVVLEGTLYVLQKKSEGTGQWTNYLGNLKGKSRANEVLNETKLQNPKQEWRVITKIEADKYLEGWNAHQLWATGRI